MSRIKQDMYPLAIAICTALLMLTSCATQSKSLALGGAVGAGAGAIAGGLADPGKDGQDRTRNVLIGTAVGGVAGIMAGALIGGSVEDQKQEAYEKGKASKAPATPAGSPRLQEPKVEAHWVDSSVIGNRYVEGHWEYQIIEPARWEGAR
ncbi:hypothetical protein WDW86_17795 [Bdellovibrionota bacterium FG-2]